MTNRDKPKTRQKETKIKHDKKRQTQNMTKRDEPKTRQKEMNPKHDKRDEPKT